VTSKDAPRSITSSQVRKAGRILRAWWVRRQVGPLIGPDEEAAFAVLDTYRAAHQYPLVKANMGLRSMLQTTASRGVVSQRLKRHFSIVDKLAREPTMQLNTMQDIAGCRAVVRTPKQVYAIFKRLERSGRMVRPYDYIGTPKLTGYRGLHAVVRYADRTGQGHLVEVQVRTEVQHEWAVAVERVGGRMGENLKGGAGPEEVRAFFRLVSQAMALEEADEDVPAELHTAIRQARARADIVMQRPRPT
jgi:ppGpp synthetase/RelA/SpoT-type nucleotidyltranferase